jgi:CRP-like cAMP-binding protein
MTHAPPPNELAIASLRRCALFTHCAADAMAEIVRRLTVRRYRRGEVIFHQGDPGDALHVVTSGSVKIVLPSPEGDEAIIATVRPGDFFGELSLLDGEPRSATATAIEATETSTLPRAVFLELLDAHPSLRDALLKGVAVELRRLTNHAEELHFLDLAGRLARRLVRLAEEGSASAQDPIALDWPYTQTDLAGMIGGTRQSVNRLLSDLIGDGLVRIERERLIITDLDELARRAER